MTTTTAASLRTKLAPWLVILVPLAFALAVCAVQGSLSIPHNDDWAYAKSARILASTGHLRMQGWVAAALVGQIAGAWPFLRLFGNSFLVLNVTMSVVAAAALWATHRLAGHFLTARRALLATAVAVVFPGALLLSTSFMSDVPALLAELFCLLAGLRALGSERAGRWLTVSLAVGLFGVTVRQQALAAPLAVLVTLLLRRGTRRRALAAGAAFVVAAGAFLVWRSGLAHADNPPADHLAIRSLVINIGQTTVLLGVVLLPVLGLLLTRLLALRRRPEAWVGGVTVLLLAAYVHHAGTDLIKGNYLSSTGAYTGAGYGGAVLFPSPVWRLVQDVGVVSAALLVGVLAVGARELLARRSLPEPHRVLLLFGVFYVGALLLPAATGFDIFDRYTMPLVVPLVVALVSSAETLPRTPVPVLVTRGPVFLGGGAVAGLTVVLTLAAAADDSARWAASSALVRAGAAPDTVSSGLEWQGTAATEPADSFKLVKGQTTVLPAYFTPMFATSRDCWLITRSPVSDPALVLTRTQTYSRVPLLRSGTIYTYRTSSC